MLDVTKIKEESENQHNNITKIYKNTLKFLLYSFILTLTSLFSGYRFRLKLFN